jgi:hypothetical protein
MAKINTFHQDQFKVAFSNFPKIYDNDTKKIDLRIYDYFVKNVIIPDMTQETVSVDFMKAVRYQPITRANDQVPQLTVEFKANEDLSNFYFLWTYVKKQRYGTLPTPTAFDNTIKSIFIDLLDNEGLKLGRIEFSEALPLSIGSLSLTTGDSSELTFPVSFVYEDFRLTLYNEDGEETYND